jgi:acetoin utilization protein AcuB
MSIRRIRDAMTPTPLTIGADQPLARAHHIMRTHRVRHLPVLEAGRLVGVVSQRDLYFIETLRDVDPAKVLVEEAMTRDPYVVGPSAELATAARAMVRRKLGAALVVERGRLLGIFTALDALKVLAAHRPARVRAA